MKSWLFLLKGRVPWEALRKRRMLCGKGTYFITVALEGRGEAHVLFAAREAYKINEMYKWLKRASL